MLGSNLSRYFKVFGCGIIFEVFQSVRKSHLNIMDRWTDRQTTYSGITAATVLCLASRGNTQSMLDTLNINRSHSFVTFVKNDGEIVNGDRLGKLIVRDCPSGSTVTRPVRFSTPSLYESHQHIELY